MGMWREENEIDEGMVKWIVGQCRFGESKGPFP